MRLLLSCLILLLTPLALGFDDDPYPVRHSEAELKGQKGDVLDFYDTVTAEE